ncbi:MAG: hypothetical protein KBT48_06310 [Firmicutes bacterium]|nr:hypothetical protein [Bacillota bacterium]
MKVYLEKGNYSFEHSRLEINEKSQEGGYIRSGLAFKIPEDCSIVRFFVYWNDKKRIDIDLHAHAYSEDGDFYVGWNSNFKKTGVYFSGDITHSDAAEYIDIQMNNPELKSVSTRICSFTGVPFDRIEMCFVGMLAVKDYGQEVKLYNPKNCFYYHELKSNVVRMRYASIDIENKVLRFVGKDEEKTSLYSLQEYLDDYFSSQNAELADTKEEADFVLRMDKAIEENELSMIDQNFWLRN